MVEKVQHSLDLIDESRRSQAHLIFTAHSIPIAMSDGSNYVRQLQESSRLVAEQLGWESWKLVYQSRSGPPTQPWLEPDVCDYIESLHQAGDTKDVVIVPIGFVSDHMEVLFDLDTEAKELCEKIGMGFQRAGTVGTHPEFVEALRQMIEERTLDEPNRLSLGDHGPSHDVCPLDCCKYERPQRPQRPQPAS
jgi:ferrochelatase